MNSGPTIRPRVTFRAQPFDRHMLLPSEMRISDVSRAMVDIPKLIRTAITGVAVIMATGHGVVCPLLAQETPAEGISALSKDELVQRAFQWEVQWARLKKLLEDERRGILAEEKRQLLAEARRRGLTTPVIRQAAERGDAEAQLALAITYDNGKGVSEDDAEAVRWYRFAAKQGLEAAQYQLGVMYAEGRGTLKDEVAAVGWFRRAAAQKYNTAQYALGVMYDLGAGVLRDPVLAHMWFNIAGANGSEVARGRRDILERDMTRDEVSRATKLARSCIASDFQDCEP